MMIGFAYCHGWSFDAQVLVPLQEELSRRFPHAAHASFDLGFTCAPQAPTLAPEIAWIALGHSYGFAWLMQQPQAWRAAIALNGFTRFCRHPGRAEGSPVRRIDSMLAKLSQDAHAVVKEFQTHCGTAAAGKLEFNPQVLAAHLQKLRDLDLSLPDCPILALSTNDDIVVPPALMHACFNHTGCTLREFSGDHMRLLREPGTTARFIEEFIETIHA